MNEKSRPKAAFDCAKLPLKSAHMVNKAWREFRLTIILGAAFIVALYVVISLAKAGVFAGYHLIF